MIEIRIAKPVNKSVYQSFYPVVVLVFRDIPYNITITVSLPSICFCLPVERIRHNTELQQYTMTMWGNDNPWGMSLGMDLQPSLESLCSLVDSDVLA